MNFIEWIFKFGNLSVQVRYNILIGAILIVLGYVIVDKDKTNKLLQDENRLLAVDCNARLDAFRDNSNREISDCKETLFRYVEANEKEYKEILFDYKKIKEVVYENSN